MMSEAPDLSQGVIFAQGGRNHWHGTAADSWFVHLAIETDIKGGPPTWFEPVSDEEYNLLHL